MRKKILILALAALPCSGIHAIAAPAATTTEPANKQIAKRPNAPSEFEVTFEIVEGKGVMNGSMKAPTLDWNTDQPLSYITKIEVTRSCSELEELDTSIEEILSPEPGALCTFKDSKDLELGYEYTYKATAYVDDSQSFGAYVYSAYAGIRIAPVTNLSATTAQQGKVPVTIEFDTPATNVEGYDHSYPLTKIVVNRKDANSFEKGESVKTFTENLAYGKHFSFTDETAEEGKKYSYTVVCHSQYGTSKDVSASVYVGLDTPSPVSDLATAKVDAGVKLTWTAPAKGKNGGYLDPASIRYNVYRSIGSGEQAMLKTNLAELAFVDDLADIEKQCTVSYAVEAYNNSGSSEKENTEELVVGPLPKLPFAETFNSGEGYSRAFDNIWEIAGDGTFTATTYGYTYSEDYSIVYLEGVNTQKEGEEVVEEDGYGAAKFGYSAEPGDRLSFSIALNAENAACPVATFYYAAIKNSDSHLVLSAKGANDETFTTLKDIASNDNFDPKKAVEDTYHWVKVNVPIDCVDSDEMQIRFEAVYGESENDVFVDEISIDNYPYVTDLTYEVDENFQITLKWSNPSTDTQKVTKFIIFLDGEAIQETDAETLSYIYNGEVDKKYEFGVKAVYGDIEPWITLPVTVETKLDGVGFVTSSGKVVATEYFDLYGRKVAKPCTGSVLIVKTTYSDGREVISKAIVKP